MRYLRATLTLEEISTTGEEDASHVVVGLEVRHRWASNGHLVGRSETTESEFKADEDAFAYRAERMAREAFRDHAANIGAWPPKPDEVEG